MFTAGSQNCTILTPTINNTFKENGSTMDIVKVDIDKNMEIYSLSPMTIYFYS